MDRRLGILQGDIAALAVDAIVNAANGSLLGGGGVDGAIHRMAGPELLAFCRTLGGCETGQARLTPGFNLPARHVIHTVGPIWRGGEQNEDALLASCYRESLNLAHRHRFATLAFPAISTGIYGFPPERAARLALRTILDFLGEHSFPERVVLVAFDESSLRHIQQAYDEFLTQDRP